jgi:essential nuclear protein 1
MYRIHFSQLFFRFYRYVLLDAVRRNFDETKTVNVHYFEAMKKAIYKPAAFFKGIVFPVVNDKHTTLKEANVYCSIISNTSIPALHAAAALMKISTGEYSGPKFMIIRSLLDKKFALPTKTISFIFDYLCSFSCFETSLPVLWHQALLVFVQRYKSELDPNRKIAIRDLVAIQNHSGISPEILREIESI